MDFDLGSIMSSFGASNSDGKVMGMDPNSLAIMAAMLGKGMSKPGSVGDVLGSGALNQIRTNKFGALLQKMLSNGGKMTMDGENTQLKIPHVGTSGEGSAFWDRGILGSKLGSNLDNSLASKLMKLMSEGGDDTGLPFFVNGSRGNIFTREYLSHTRLDLPLLQIFEILSMSKTRISVVKKSRKR